MSSFQITVPHSSQLAGWVQKTHTEKKVLRQSETVVPLLRANCVVRPFSIFDLGKFVFFMVIFHTNSREARIWPKKCMGIQEKIQRPEKHVKKKF